MKRAQMTLMVAIIAGLFAGTLPALALTDFDRGNEFYARGQYQAAADAYIDAICAKPRAYAVHYQLGNTYMKLNRMSDAQIEYEMCLEMYPDASTKAQTKKALHYLTGTSTGRAAVPQESGHELDQKLSAEGDRRAALEALKAEKQKEAISKAAVQQADQLKANAKAQVEQARLNSTWWRVDVDKGERVPLLAPGVESAIVDRADAHAAATLEQAKRKAETITPGDGVSVTDGLRSQIQPSGTSNVRLSPIGTSVYVRNYQSTGKKVAASSSSVK